MKYCAYLSSQSRASWSLQLSIFLSTNVIATHALLSVPLNLMAGGVVLAC